MSPTIYIANAARQGLALKQKWRPTDKTFATTIPDVGYPLSFDEFDSNPVQFKPTSESELDTAIKKGQKKYITFLVNNLPRHFVLKGVRELCTCLL